MKEVTELKRIPLERSFSNKLLNDQNFGRILFTIDGQVGLFKGEPKQLYWWNRLYKDITDKIQLVSKSRIALLNDYALKDEDGKIKTITTENGHQRPDLGDNEAEAEAKFAELLDETVTLKFPGLSAIITDRLATYLSPRDMRMVYDHLAVAYEGDDDERESPSEEAVGK